MLVYLYYEQKIWLLDRILVTCNLKSFW